MSEVCFECGDVKFQVCPACDTVEGIADNFNKDTVPPIEARVWIIESRAGVVLTHYASVAEKYAVSPLHVVTPYVSKLP